MKSQNSVKSNKWQECCQQLVSCRRQLTAVCAFWNKRCNPNNILRVKYSEHDGVQEKLLTKFVVTYFENACICAQQFLHTKVKLQKGRKKKWRCWGFDDNDYDDDDDDECGDDGGAGGDVLMIW